MQGKTSNHFDVQLNNKKFIITIIADVISIKEKCHEIRVVTKPANEYRIVTPHLIIYDSISGPSERRKEICLISLATKSDMSRAAF